MFIKKGYYWYWFCSDLSYQSTNESKINTSVASSNEGRGFQASTRWLFFSLFAYSSIWSLERFWRNLLKTWRSSEELRILPLNLRIGSWTIFREFQDLQTPRNPQNNRKVLGSKHFPFFSLSLYRKFPWKVFKEEISNFSSKSDKRGFPRPKHKTLCIWIETGCDLFSAQPFCASGLW